LPYFSTFFEIQQQPPPAFRIKLDTLFSALPLRHKSQKTGFLLALRAPEMINCGALVWLISTSKQPTTANAPASAGYAEHKGCPKIRKIDAAADSTRRI
jgi:hypothetical protein